MKSLQTKREESDPIDNEQDDEKVRIPELPNDLKVEILTRLRGKTLMKFQCVSKEWSSIIRSKTFIDSFFAKRLRSPSRLMVAFTNGMLGRQDGNHLFIFSSSYKNEESSSLIANLEMIVPSVTFHYNSKPTFIHGYFCFRGDGRLHVCNPSTGEVSISPCIGSHISMGYDPIDGQFKVLTLMSSLYENRNFLVHEVSTRIGGGWKRNQVISLPYYPITDELCINGFVYCGAWAPRNRMDPVIMCFDVRSESFSFISAPKDVVYYESYSILIEYNGKLASIVRYPFSITVTSFDLWILEDVERHDWSKQTFELPFPLMMRMNSPGTNKDGEIIFAPKNLPKNVEPFFIFYYNVQRKDLRRVRLHGIADTQEFRRKYGLIDTCCVSLAPQHLENISPF